MSWPEWRRVYEVWKSFGVPRIESVRFDPGQHSIFTSWAERRNHSPLHHSSVQRQTALHLFFNLRDESSELVAAYKINACCIEYSLRRFRENVLEPAFNTMGTSSFRWWRSNARLVLPYTDGKTELDVLALDMEEHDWKLIVNQSARKWTIIANELVIVRNPSLMDWESDEYRDYIEHCKRRREERDREDYERLKARFEGSEAPAGPGRRSM